MHLWGRIPKRCAPVAYQAPVRSVVSRIVSQREGPVARRLRAVGHLELREDLSNGILHGEHRDEETGRDLAIAETIAAKVLAAGELQLMRAHVASAGWPVSQMLASWPCP